MIGPENGGLPSTNFGADWNIRLSADFVGCMVKSSQTVTQWEAFRVGSFLNVLSRGRVPSRFVGLFELLCNGL